MEPATHSRNIHALTSLRAFAAAWVVLYHFRLDVDALLPGLSPIMPLFDAGYAGVDIFFVLSGFIISYTYLEQLRNPHPGRWLRFLWLRLARIYPLHLLTLAAFYLILVPGPWSDLSVEGLRTNIHNPDLPRQLLLTHGWGATGNHAWNYPAWSISVEWAAYLVFPLAAVLLWRLRAVPVAMAGLVASIAFNIGSFIVIARTGYQGDILLVRIVGEFLAGAFLFLLFQSGVTARVAPFAWDMAAAGSAIVAVAVTILVARTSDIAPVVAVPAYALLILSLAHAAGPTSRFLSLPVLVYAGEASYALYMTHALTQRFIWTALPPAEYLTDPLVERAGLVAVYALLLAVVAVVAYELAEKPSRNAMRAIVPRPASVPVPLPDLREPVAVSSTSEA